MTLGRVVLEICEPTDTHTDRQTNKQTDRHTHTDTLIANGKNISEATTVLEICVRACVCVLCISNNELK